ncbi:MAG: integrase [Mesorhizobium sp.]|nr:MAG: integrase [Mesorhizobium sp.]
MYPYLFKRNGNWHYVRRVPKEMAALDKRVFVRHSTKIKILDDPQGVGAGRAAAAFNREVESYWKGLREGKAAEAQNRYAAARSRVRQIGFDYATVEELAAKRSTAEILTRLEHLIAGKANIESPTDVAAVLGGEEMKAPKASELFDEFEKLQRASIADFSDDQLRKWRNPRKRAITNFITSAGDKEITRYTRGDALDFRTWWQDRVLEEGVQIDTANKDIGHINNMFHALDTALRLGMDPVFGSLRIAGGQYVQRPPFDPKFVQDNLLKQSAMDTLNPEARRVIYLISETGLRLSEACNLTRDTIVLTGPVPHIKVRPDGRRMKTPQSEREIPLVGVALVAMRKQPNGFPRYRDKADALSGLINKYLDDHGLRPTKDHTAYSLRHTFEDRLTDVEAPEKMIANLMGHKYQRPKYGRGHTLEAKQIWLQRIAFKAPATV